MSVTGRLHGSKKAKYLYNEAWSGFWLMFSSLGLVLCQMKSKQLRALVETIISLSSPWEPQTQEGWQSQCETDCGGRIFINFDPLGHWAPFPRHSLPWLLTVYPRRGLQQSISICIKLSVDRKERYLQYPRDRLTWRFIYTCLAERSPS